MKKITTTEGFAPGKKVTAREKTTKNIKKRGPNKRTSTETKVLFLRDVIASFRGVRGWTWQMIGDLFGTDPKNIQNIREGRNKKSFTKTLIDGIYANVEAHFAEGLAADREELYSGQPKVFDSTRHRQSNTVSATTAGITGIAKGA
jgi:hypothetical protein